MRSLHSGCQACDREREATGCVPAGVPLRQESDGHSLAPHQPSPGSGRQQGEQDCCSDYYEFDQPLLGRGHHPVGHEPGQLPGRGEEDAVQVNDPRSRTRGFHPVPQVRQFVPGQGLHGQY